MYIVPISEHNVKNSCSYYSVLNILQILLTETFQCCSRAVCLVIQFSHNSDYLAVLSITGATFLL